MEEIFLRLSFQHSSADTPGKRFLTWEGGWLAPLTLLAALHKNVTDGRISALLLMNTQLLPPYAAHAAVTRAHRSSNREC